MFGLVKTDLLVKNKNVLEFDVAQLVATALNHTSKGGVQELHYKQVEKYLTDVWFRGRSLVANATDVLQRCTE